MQDVLLKKATLLHGHFFEADMFKVNDVNKNTQVSSSKVKKSGSGASFSSYLDAVKSGGAQAVSGAFMNITDAIFATQMVDERTQEQMKRQAVKTGKTLLEKLEEIRDGLLLGHISKDKLIEISRYVKNINIQTEDKELNGLIEDIILRVEVELAKLTR